MFVVATVLAYKSQNLRQNIAGKVGGDLHPGHKIFFAAAKYTTSDLTRRQGCREVKFDADDVDCADLLFPLQVLKNHLQLIHRSMIVDHIWTQFLGGAGDVHGGDLYTSIYGSCLCVQPYLTLQLCSMSLLANVYLFYELVNHV